MVGGDVYGAAGFEASVDIKKVVVAEESPFVMAFFWPWIREIQV